MEKWNEFLLHLRREINQQIAARQNIQLRERRVHDEALRRKRHHLPDFGSHAAAVVFLGEEPAHLFRRHVGANIFGIDARARLGNRILVQIGGKNLQRDFFPRLELLHHFLEHHRQRISLLAGGTTRHPRPQHMTMRTEGDERGENFFAQLFPASGIAEETRHADQQFFEQQIQLLRILLQVTDVVADLDDLMDAHAAFDAAVESVFLVE